MRADTARIVIFVLFFLVHALVVILALLLISPVQDAISVATIVLPLTAAVITVMQNYQSRNLFTADERALPRRTIWLTFAPILIILILILLPFAFYYEGRVITTVDAVRIYVAVLETAMAPLVLRAIRDLFPQPAGNG